jgi:hypothetical protein
LIELGLNDMLWQRISEQFRAFIGLTAFEELCRAWTLGQARAGRLPFAPEIVGSHWANDAQVDVVAVNWREKAILLGECKWGVHAVGPDVVRDLVEKAPKVVAKCASASGAGDETEAWRVHYVFFARAGFADSARAEADAADAQLVDLMQLDADLRGDL